MARRLPDRSRGWFRRGAVALLVAGTCGALLVAQSPDREQDYRAAMQAGDQAIARRQFRAAIDAFKRANALHDKRDPLANFGLSRAYFSMEAFKSAADACTEALKFTGDDRRLEAQMRYMRGLSLVALGVQKGGTREFRDAEADFRTTLDLTDQIPIAAYQLGAVLLRQNRDDEGIQVLQAYVDRAGGSADVEEARRLIANPRRAREPYAPEFSIVTLGGEYLALEDLRGKVVLLDFWGTWCGPCRAATPDIVRFYNKHADDPFVMIGVAVHDREDAWKAYIDEHRMVWPQYFDRNDQLARAFKVTGFPTYLVLDADGIIKARLLGWGPGITNRLEEEIKRAIKARGTAAPLPALLARPTGR
jgi:thiol-disulfide isomerase/thioredoxin